MTKRATAFLLALLMVAQVLVPGAARAEKAILPYPKMDRELVQVGKVDGKDYPKLTNKVILDIQKQATKNSRKHIQRKSGATAFNTPYLPGQDIPDKDKPRIVGKVSADFKTIGLDGGPFDWEGVFGKDSNGNPGKAKLVFKQWLNNKETGLFYELEVSRDGKYSWTDWTGEPARIPLYSKGLEAYTYSAYLDQDVSEKVKLLTYRIAGTPSDGGFEKDPETGLNVANIVIDLSIQQVASTKFVSEWHTGLAEDARPPVNGEFDNKIDEYPGYFPFSTKDGGSIIIRNDFVNNSDYEDPGYSEYDSSDLVKTPVVKVVEGLEFADENDEEGSPTYHLDEDNNIITTLDKKHEFKYDFTYDVINGGKLTMTEIIPVTFDANGGKFASITEPNAEQKIVKEVEYEGTLTDKAENPTRPGKAFKGWATDASGTTPAPDSAYENLITAKTFYAIWSDEDIQVEELKTTESRITFRKNGTQNIINDFVPTFEQLKSQVKVKDASGNFAQLPETGVTFSIVDDEGKEYTEDSVDLKKFIYDKVKENNADEVSRTETVKAKIKYDDGTTREIEIPIVVLKNIYRGSDQGNRLPHIPDDYVKVTIDPTDKAQDPQKTYYYVNPKAKVVVPVKDPVGSGDNKFSKWTMKADSATGDGADYTKTDRHQFTEASTITAQYGTGAIKIQYVDQNGDEIDKKYQIAGNDYPSEKSGSLGKAANDSDFAEKGPDFKGYIYSSRESIKGKKYKDPTDPDNLDIVTYKYYKKVTTDTPKNPNVYFPVIFDANGGEFEAAPKDKKTVYVYFDGNDATVEKVTFKEVKDEFDKAYSNPTKDGFDFKEWQNAKTDGTKPADDYEIQFKGWNWDADPVNGYVPETFYAHYAKASALISYLDLDGKPIADDFKIDGVEYPTEKDGKLDEAIASDVFTADTAPKLIGYKFNRIELNPKDGKYALDNKATIKIYYEKLPDVIPEKDGSGNPNEKPDGYVEVKFVPTDKAKDMTEKIFYVNPKKDVTIPIADPEANATYTFKEWKMGVNADGAVYNPTTAQKFTEATTVITATYEETENIIPYDPSVPDPKVRPEGYVRVTFAADPGLKLTESKAYYVKKNAGITLGNKDLVKPGYEAQTGYKFKEWDKEDSLVIEAGDIVVTAKATTLDNVIPETNDQGQPNEKPKGYNEVTFVVKTGDESKGSITGVAKFYVNPNEYVTINPPATKAETGFEFGAWDTDATIPTVYDKDTTITGSFNGLKDVIPKTKTDDSEKPAGYVTVTFMAIGEGYIPTGETRVYFVNPEKEVTITPPTAKGKTGYVFNKWNQDTTKPTKYPKDWIVSANFRKLDAIIPSTDGDGKPNPKPEGYVTVTFLKGENGKDITGQTVYYVNPNAEPTKKLGDPSIVKPTVTPEIGYTFVKWSIGDEELIKGNKRPVAEYKALDDVIPKTTSDESEKPDGYITVTFSTETNGKIKGTTDTKTKVVYVNPNKAVVLTSHAPEVDPNTGFTFADWDTSITKAIKYENGDVIKAKYNPIGAVIPKINDDTEKPAGYVTVTFEKGTNGESITGTTVYYVDPNKEVTVPAPTVTPNTGYKQKTGDAAWDQALTQKFTAENTTITAQYEALDNIIPQKNTDGSDKPNGYKTVKFVGEHGTLAVDTVFYVNPEKVVDFTNTVKGFTKTPDFSYTEVGGIWSSEEFNKKFTDDTTFTFTFAKLADVIPEKKPDGTSNVQPKDYVKVTLIPTDKATDDTNKVFFVNPKENVVIPSTNPVGKKITDANDNTYTFTFKEWTSTIGIHGTWKPGETIKGTFTQDTDIEAKYNVKAEKIVNGPIAKDNVVTPKGDVPNAGDLIKNVPGSEEDPLPDGTTFNYKDNKNPDLSEPGEKTVVVEVHYPNGKTAIVNVPITVVDNVVPQIGGEDGKKPLVPDNYVKVTVDTTDKATDNTKFTKVFWVKPNVEVTIPDILAPTGKPETVGGVTKTNIFDKWQRQGAVPAKFYDKDITDTFTENTTIVATYTVKDNVPPVGKDNPWIPQNSKPSPKDFIENPYDDDNPDNPNNLPPGTKFEFVPGTEPNTSEPGDGKKTTIKVTYPNGEVKEVEVTFRVTGDVVEQPDPNDPNTKPAVPDNFVQVTVDPTNQAKDPTKHVFWVNPEKVVAIPATDPTAKDASKIFKSWDGLLTQQFKNDTIITAQYGNKPADPRPTSDYVVTEQGVQPKPQDYKDAITPPAGKRIKDVEIVERPNVNNPGKTSATVKVIYEDGTTDQITVPVFVQKKDTPTPELRPYPVPGDCNNTCDQPNAPNQPNQPNQPNVGKDALNTTDHYQYLIGYPDGNFAPNKGMTRAEAATMFTRLLNERPVKWRHYNAGLSDIRPGDWYANTVGYAVQRGIVSGYPDGSFKPNKPITRAEFAAIASRFDALAQGNAISFSDLAPSHWGYNAIRSAATKGWISGYPDNTFRPEQAITRAEVTAITNRMLNRHADLYWIDAHPSEVIRFGDVKRSDWYFEPIMEATMGHDFIRDRDKKTEHWTGINGKSFI